MCFQRNFEREFEGKRYMYLFILSYVLCYITKSVQRNFETLFEGKRYMYLFICQHISMLLAPLNTCIHINAVWPAVHAIDISRSDK